MGSLSLTFLLFFVLLAIPSPFAEAKHHLPESAACKDETREDCMSGYCSSSNGCSKPSPKLGKVGGDGDCSIPSNCYSGMCINYKCCTDATVEGKVGGGGCCNMGSHCYSGRCDERSTPGTCSLDSPVQGKVGGGGYCTLMSDCYSGFCDDNTDECSTDSDTQGKVAVGGRCQHGGHCESGKCSSDKVCSAALSKGQRNPDGWPCEDPGDCMSGYCHITAQLKYVCANKRVEKKGDNGAYCESNDECYSGHCVEKACKRQPGAKIGEHCYSDIGCESQNCDSKENKCLRATTTTTTEGYDEDDRGDRRRNRRVKCYKDEDCFDRFGYRSFCDDGYCSGGDEKKSLAVMMIMIGGWWLMVLCGPTAVVVG